MEQDSKRIYRKDSSLLNNPDLPPQASVNRTKKPANLRLSPDFLKSVDTHAQALSMSRTEFITAALEEKIAQLELTEVQENAPLSTSVDFGKLKGKRAPKGTNVKPLQLQFEQTLISGIRLGAKEHDVSQSLFVGEILRHHSIISEYLGATGNNPAQLKVMNDEIKALEVSFSNAADSVALGNAIRTTRLNAGFSQSQLEAQSGVSKWNISKIERGSGGTLQNMEKIAEATNTLLQIRFDPKI
jgi:DNA-binding XRE family transcriptional regulator